MVPGAPAREPLPARGLVWAGVPIITFGLGAPFAFAYGGIRARSRELWVAAVFYTGAYAAIVAAFMSSNIGLILLGVLLLPVMWITTSVHSFLVRRQVFPHGALGNDANIQAVRVAQHRRELREQARRLAAEDPALARELCIGRPDMARSYDDGGLIDVNHAPHHVLAQLPGLDEPLARRVVELRSSQGGFVSAEELAMDADIPPDQVNLIAEYAIFLR
jgi:DNA uptake protein ComE-like DNA-binding protein